MSAPKVTIKGNVVEIEGRTRKVILPAGYEPDGEGGLVLDRTGSYVARFEAAWIINALFAALAEERERSAGLQAKADALDALELMIEVNPVKVGIATEGPSGKTFAINHKWRKYVFGPSLAAAILAAGAGANGGGE
jgi:hypothetical protein